MAPPPGPHRRYRLSSGPVTSSGSSGMTMRRGHSIMPLTVSRRKGSNHACVLDMGCHVEGGVAVPPKNAGGHPPPHQAAAGEFPEKSSCLNLLSWLLSPSAVHLDGSC